MRSLININDELSVVLLCSLVTDSDFKDFPELLKNDVHNNVLLIETN